MSLGKLLKLTLAGTLIPAGAFVGYRKRQIYELQSIKEQEIGRLEAELAGLVPRYQREIADQQHALEDAKEQEKLKVTLWEDRLRRFKEETEEFLSYARVIPKQLQELEDLNKMYWMVAKVLQDSRVEEVKFEGVCRKVHQVLLAGHKVLLDPDAVKSKDDLLRALREVQAAGPDPLLDGLAQAAAQLEGNPFESHHLIEQQFNDALDLVEQSQFSIAGPDRNDLTARLFSKAQQSLRFGLTDPVISEVTAKAPRKFVTEREVRQGLQFAEDFVAAAREGQVAVAVTKVPLNAIPEGRDAIAAMEAWVGAARAYVSLRQLVMALNAHLTAQALRLGIPEMAPAAAPATAA